MPVRLGPFERRDERAILGDVVGRDADRFADLLEDSAVGRLDPDAVSRRPRISASAAVDVRDEMIGRQGASCVMARSHYGVGCVDVGAGCAAAGAVGTGHEEDAVAGGRTG